MANSQKQLIINHCSLRPPKSSIQPKLSTILDLFMQNKANFKKVKFYATYEMTRTYAKWTLGVIGKTKPNKANSKPIKANLKNAKNERKPSINKGLRKMSNWAIYPKQSQFKAKQSQSNSPAVLFFTEITTYFLLAEGVQNRIKYPKLIIEITDISKQNLTQKWG